VKCPKCGSEPTAFPHPPKFSLDDKYIRYRIQARYEEEEKEEEKEQKMK
jgi:H/ACA ribonucleoprotein complex subunit 3